MISDKVTAGKTIGRRMRPRVRKAKQPGLRHKHLVLDQRKIDAAKKYFAVRTEQEAVEKALEIAESDAAIRQVLSELGGKGFDWEDPWK